MHLQGEGLVALKFDEQHRELVVRRHGLRLVIQPPTGEALLQIRK